MRRDALSDRAVRDWVGETSIQRGRGYASGDAMIDPVVQGDALKARVQGSADRPYRAWARVAGGRVVEADCSCPVGDGGRCKHVAALLLTFRDNPDEFTEVEETDANLQARDKPELIALIKQMLRKAPELESLLAVPVPGGKRKAPLSPDVYRRQATAALRSVPEYEEWAGDEATQEVGAIVETGEEFEAAGDPATAAAVFQGVTAAAVDDGRDLLGNDDGGADGVTGRLAAGLLRCLDREPAGPRRESLFRSLFDLTVAFFSGSEEGDDFDPLDGMLHLATPAERRTLAGWARQLRPARVGFGDEYDRQRFARILTRIDADVLGDAGYLDVCRKAGMTREVVAKLLALGRGDEAVREVDAATHTDRAHDLLRFADILDEGGQGPAAEKLIRERAARVEGWHRSSLLGWLKKRAAAGGDAAEVRRLADALLDADPSLDRYQEVRRLTPKAEWPARRKAVLQALTQARRHGLVIDIHLNEGEVAAALATLAAHRDTGRTLAVAAAAEADHPAESAALYRKAAEAQIEQRNRGAYQEACRFLKKVGDLLARTGAAAEFPRYVAGLLAKYPTLRAFKEEVGNAKLVAAVPSTAVRQKGGRKT